MKKPYLSNAVLGAAYGHRYLPVNRKVFIKTEGEKQALKRMKKHVTNKGAMHTVVAFSLDPHSATFGDGQLVTRSGKVVTLS